MKNAFLITFLLLGFLLHSQAPQWQYRNTPGQASLRGIAAVSAQQCWVSGNRGSVFRTVDGGQSWQDVSPPGYDSLQFRDIHAWSPREALILSAGLPAVILKTSNGGQSWRETYRNEQTGVFFDAMDFWDGAHGIAFSDAIDEKILMITTRR
ncbi:MAG: YCF48-related protein [Owenweeksia sp.]|nr:YCF48-related protein [Owenweeksia sp.]